MIISMSFSKVFFLASPYLRQGFGRQASLSGVEEVKEAN
jgi:hypothetical protein